MGQRLYKRADSPNWYVNLGGKYVSTRCRDKRAAESRADELEREHRSPTHRAANKTTIASALSRALDDRRARGRAAGTIEMWETKSKHVTRVLGADTVLSQIDASAVDAYTATRMREGASRNTVGKELGVLGVTLKLARRRGEYTQEVAAVMPQGWESDYKPKERSLSPDEMRRLIADLEDDDLPMTRKPPGPARKDGSKRSKEGPAPVASRYRRTRTGSMKERAARVAFIVATSARWSESNRARREDVLFIEGRPAFVNIRGSKTKTSTRTVPVLPTTAALIALALKHGNRDGLLFSPWDSVRRDLHAACKRIGIAPCSPNDLRRTTSQWLRDRGIENGLIYPVMGHKDARMVERIYGRISPTALKAALQDRLGP